MKPRHSKNTLKMNEQQNEIICIFKENISNYKINKSARIKVDNLLEKRENLLPLLYETVRPDSEIPEEALEILYQKGAFDDETQENLRNFIYQLARLGETDFEKIERFLGKYPEEKATLDDKMAAAWRFLAEEKRTGYCIDPRINARSMEDILIHKPQIAKSILELRQSERLIVIANSKFSYHSDLSLLAFSSRSTQWVHSCGIDLVLFLGIQFMSVGVSKMFEAEDNQRSKIDQWCAISKKHRDAYKKLLELDLENEKEFQRWKQKWLPDHKFEESPLQAWCEKVINQQETQVDNDGPIWPHEKKSTLSDDKEKEANLFHVRFPGKDQESSFFFRLSSGICTPLMDGCNIGLQQLIYHPVKFLADIQHGKANAKIQEDPEGFSRELQYWLDLDDRTSNVFSTNDVDIEDVIAWIIKAPSWQHWRNKTGKNILDLVAEKSTQSVISTKALMKIVKNWPDILLNKDNDGVVTLDRIQLSSEQKSQIKKTLLQQHISDTSPKKKTVGNLKM